MYPGDGKDKPLRKEWGNNQPSKAVTEQVGDLEELDESGGPADPMAATPTTNPDGTPVYNPITEGQVEAAEAGSGEADEAPPAHG